MDTFYFFVLNSALKWKKINGENGVVNMSSDWKEALITVYYFDSDVQETVGCYLTYITSDMLSAVNTRLGIGGYYINNEDYGACWLNATKTRISIRYYVYYARNINADEVAITVRYR